MFRVPIQVGAYAWNLAWEKGQGYLLQAPRSAYDRVLLAVQSASDSRVATQLPVAAVAMLPGFVL